MACKGSGVRIPVPPPRSPHHKGPVSYTHLDVYKRQLYGNAREVPISKTSFRWRNPVDSHLDVVHDVLDSGVVLEAVHRQVLAVARVLAVSYTHLDVYKRQPHNLGTSLSCRSRVFDSNSAKSALFAKHTNKFRVFPGDGSEHPSWVHWSASRTPVRSEAPRSWRPGHCMATVSYTHLDVYKRQT